MMYTYNYPYAMAAPQHVGVSGPIDDYVESIAQEAFNRMRPVIDQYAYEKIEEVKARIPEFVDDALAQMRTKIPDITDEVIQSILARRDMIIQQTLDSLLPQVLPQAEAFIEKTMSEGPIREEIDTIKGQAATAAVVGGVATVLLTSGLTYWLVSRKKSG